MKILVTAPAGNVGRWVVRELLAPEFSVRVLAREPSRLPAEVHAQAEIIPGSTDDAAALVRALDGVEAAFWCVPPARLQDTHASAHYERHARAARQALRQAGTPRVVTVSTGGKGFARRVSPLLGLHAMEDVLNDSGASIRHLRCGFFMENFLSQANSIFRHALLSFPAPGDIRLPMVAGRDAADVALRWLVRRDWRGVGALGVHGPADLSFEEAAGLLGQTLRQGVRYKEAPANQFVQGLLALGASVDYARSQLNLFAELAAGVSRAEPRSPESTTPTTLAAWAESELAPRAAALRSGEARRPPGPADDGRVELTHGVSLQQRTPDGICF